ncbi:MAG: tetratricopeptide repeat protein [Desulfovibrionaceae bacterium]
MDEQSYDPSEEISLEQALDMAVDCHRQGRLDEAVALYAQILEAAPNHGPTLTLAGACRLQQGDEEQALGLLDAALASGYGAPELRHNRALALKAMGRLEEAVREFERALDADPGRLSSLYNLANTLRELGETAKAKDRYMELLEINPVHTDALVNLSRLLESEGETEEALALAQGAADTNAAAGHLRLGQILERLGRYQEAEQAFLDCLELTPDDALGAGLHLARLRGTAPDKAPDGFVATLYDQYAERFDDHLTSSLSYRGPETLALALAERLAPDASLDVLDIGCGTGLCGSALRPYAERLHGVDLSEKMLGKAAKRKIYNLLESAEAEAYLAAHPESFDLAAAIDTFLYAGDLHSVIRAAASSLRPGGLFIFTVESGEKAFELTGDMRYAHSEDHLRDCASAAGLEIAAIDEISLRTDAGEPVASLMAVLQKPIEDN